MLPLPDFAAAESCLVADLGGTNARFALVDCARLRREGLAAPLDCLQTLEVREHRTLADALDHYLTRWADGRRPQLAVLAVASALRGDQVRFTNNDWSFSISELQARLGLRSLQVINDFAAIAWAVPELRSADVRSIGSVGLGEGEADAPKVVLGPGTGLGLAAVHQCGERVHVIETEGGHVGFAPQTDAEIEILRLLRPRFGRVSCERLLCGDGLVNLYQACRHMAGLPEEGVEPREVSARAQAGEPLAETAVEHFCQLLGGFAGDAALLHGAWGGVFLAGGLLPHLLTDDRLPALRARFEDKGRFAGLLRRTPLLQITRPHVGKLGAAAYALRAFAAPSRTMD